MTQAGTWQTLDAPVSGEFNLSLNYFHFGWIFAECGDLGPKHAFLTQNRLQSDYQAWFTVKRYSPMRKLAMLFPDRVGVSKRALLPSPIGDCALRPSHSRGG